MEFPIFHFQWNMEFPISNFQKKSGNISKKKVPNAKSKAIGNSS